MGYEEKILNKKVDHSPRSLPSHVEEFMKSSVYRDYIDELEVRITDMDNIKEGCTQEEFWKTQGGITALKMVATIFVDLYENAKADAEAAAAQEEDDGERI